MHEVLIILLIIIIVGFQVKIFIDTTKKISLFKEILPEASNFETVKVYIPESQIKEIKIDYILNNLNKFQSPLKNEIIELEETFEEEDFVDDYFEKEIQERIEEETIDHESLIWISKGNEEKKIQLKLLKSYEILGWVRIQ